MEVSALISRQDFETAVDAARSIGTRQTVPGLAAPLNVDLEGRVRVVWDRIEAALRDAFQRGRERAEELVSSAVEEAERLLATAGQKAYDIHQALLAQLQAYVSMLVDAALSQFRQQLVLDGAVYALTDVEQTQRISVTGSLASNITNLVSLTSAGEISVTVRYSALGRQGHAPVSE